MSAVEYGFRHVIILGDINTSHRRIDHCSPDTDPVTAHLLVVSSTFSVVAY